MTYQNNPSWGGGAMTLPVSEAPADVRMDFIRKTYIHLALAIAALVAVLTVFFATVPPETQAAMFSFVLGGYMWLGVLGGFMVVGYLAQMLAMSHQPQAMQYAGLGVYVLAQAAILSPLLWLANLYFPGTIATAGIVTVTMFLALTTFVFITGTDFSFLRGILTIAFFVALGLIVASILIGFTLGVLFSAGMIILASGAVLHSTSNVMHHHTPGQHVAAALALFAAIALLFWYILNLLMYLNRD